MPFLKWFEFSFVWEKKKINFKKKKFKISFKYLKKINFQINFDKIKAKKIFSFFHTYFFPLNYNFEIDKTMDKLNNIQKKKKIFLQFPEGLQKFSEKIIIILQKSLKFTNQFFLSNRTIFGACCIEDFNSKFIGCEILLHYGHSCLNPIVKCEVVVFYIFLEIFFDISCLVEDIKKNFFNKKIWNFFSTIQFSSCLLKINLKLREYFKNYQINIQKNKPLSPGEILGCTGVSSKIHENIVYIGDGRFHLESIMLNNPLSFFLQFNPFSHFLFGVEFSFLNFLREREFVLFKSFFKKKNSALIIGSLGRQGNPEILKRLKELSNKKNLYFFFGSIAEISVDKLNFIGNEFAEIWIQIACPRLSSDWGKYFKAPLLSSYEMVTLMNLNRWDNFFFPMDFYSQEGGFWGNYSCKNSTYLIKKSH
jgi:2-(3-amino-3-carboxypropyl)histidine synthase